MDKKIKEEIISFILEKGTGGIDNILESISPVSVVAIGLKDSLKGYILNTKKILHNNTNRYVFFLYSKIPGRLYYYLSDETFTKIDTCKKELEQYIKLFPLYGFRKSHCIT